MKVIHYFNYAEESVSRFERNGLPSVAVPDEGLSLRDLIDRHMRGGKVKTFNPVFDDTTPAGLENLDAIERQVVSRQVADMIKTTRGKLMTARDARKRAADEAAIIAKHEASKPKVHLSEGVPGKLPGDRVPKDYKSGE